MQHALQANELAGGWLSSHDGVRVLSLDCFDTLLWRKVAAPTDVFFTLAESPEFTRLGLNARLRVRAEKEARRINWITRQSYEVSIEEIYRQALPGAGEDDIAALAARELACEIDHCFVFKPVFDLVVQARQQGLKVVIVSDTYFSARQLKRLLFAAMPELEGLVDAVYCSSEHGLSKAAGIWRKVLPLLEVQPGQVLHLGDNLEADLNSPQRFGIRAAHLVHQQEDVAKIIAGRAQAAVQLLPELRHREPMPSHFHAQIAASTHSDALSAFGYASMGPILYAFAEFILAEQRQLEAAGARVRLGFLLRDGYLPSKACAALAGQPVGSELNISRFTAIAASLDSRERVVALLSKMLARDSIEVLARQLLLPPELARKVVRLSQQAAQPELEFAALVLQKRNLEEIMAASAAFRKRLVAHVRKVTGVEPGDTLMFVDLGYSGTAQNLLKDVLKQDLGVELVGRYLIADHVLPGQSDRRGLLDATRIDGRVVQALTGDYIAGFEMLCTQNAPSTVGYTDAGDPVYSAPALDVRQHASVAAIQAGCLRFIADARALPARHKPAASERELAQSAAIDLARMLYFPTPMELDCMSQFQFDFNLGTDKKMALFDTGAGLRDMRRQGFGYMNAGLAEMRTNYTMELRQLDLSLSVLLLAQNRYGFDMQPASASYRQETVRVLVANQGGHTYQEMAAPATYDGYFSLCVPLSASFDVGILFGHSYSWVQVDSVQLIRNGDLRSGVDMEPGEAIGFDGMEHRDNGLFQAVAGGMMYLPGKGDYEPGTMCRIIFRPIAAAAVAPVPAAEAPASAPGAVVEAAPAAPTGLHDICVISCYGAADPGIAAFLNGLHRALAARGICLLLLTTQANPALEPLALEIPYLLADFDQQLGAGGETAPFHPHLATFVSEQVNAADGQDSEAVRRGIAKCEAFYAALGNAVGPCAGFLWNTTLPHGRIARNTLASTGVPAYCIERGWLPRTFQLHTFENNAYSDFFTSFALNRGLPDLLPEYGAQAEPFNTAQQYYGEQAIQKYDGGERMDAAALRSKYRLGDKQLVVCFCASAGSSVGPHDMPSMAFTSPYFENVSDALALLAELLAPYPDVCVLVQEHPIQRAIGKPAVLPAGFIRSEGENIHTLLHAADRLVFIGSTTVQAEALLLDTPRLSMSRHPASHVGASYGLVEEGSAAVAAWMDDSRAAATATAARGLVNYLCSEQLIRDETLPGFVGRGIDDLATFIAGLSRPSKASVEERLQRFFAEVEALMPQNAH